MKLRTLAVLALSAAALAAPASAATLSNGGFETGDLTGWAATDGYVDVVTQTDDAIGVPPFGQTYLPVEGGQFARLTAGSDLEVYTTLSQAFDIAVTSRLSGWAAFLAFDYLPYDDDAFVRVFSLASEEVVFTSSVAAVGDYGRTDWTSFSTGLLGPGSYVIEAGVRDNLDFGGSSQLLLDGVQLTAAVVPEPATWAFMILGFGAVGGVIRTRRATATAAASAA